MSYYLGRKLISALQTHKCSRYLKVKNVNMEEEGESSPSLFLTHKVPAEVKILITSILKIKLDRGKGSLRNR